MNLTSISLKLAQDANYWKYTLYSNIKIYIKIILKSVANIWVFFGVYFKFQGFQVPLS